MRPGAATLAVAALLLFPPTVVGPRTPSLRRAVIYVQPGSVSRDRQLKHCTDYCTEHGYDVHSIVPHAGVKDAVATAAGEADLIVTAFAGRSRPGDLRELAADAGVPVEYVRPPVVRREIVVMLATMYRESGRDIRKMAQMLGETTSSLRATLARMGILNERKRPDRDEE